jgi:hypothetical protein
MRSDFLTKRNNFSTSRSDFFTPRSEKWTLQLDFFIVYSKKVNPPPGFRSVNVDEERCRDRNSSHYSSLIKSHKPFQVK